MSIEIRLDQDEMIAWRRHFHRHPELSNQERATSEFILERLKEFGLEAEQEREGFGVIGRLDTGRSGPGAAFRADMDALPIQDAKLVSYSSLSDGVCHACGHDGHMAILLGVAKVLSRQRDRLSGRLVFLFQPSEELLPGGALRMIENGCLEGVDRIYGLHLSNSMETGFLSTVPGPMMASSEFFLLELTGKGGHGAIPEAAIDPIVATAQAVVLLQTIVSRTVSPLDPAVLTVGSIHGGTANNIIAEKVELSGTFRCFSAATSEKIKQKMHDQLQGLCTACGTQYALKFLPGFPSLSNHKQAVKEWHEAAGKLFPPSRMLTQEKVMLGEDFGRYLEKVPGCYFFLGCRKPGEIEVIHHHHPLFDMDENALEIGASLLVQLAFDRCGIREEGYHA